MAAGSDEVSPDNLSDLEQLFFLMHQYEASDLHLKVGAPPIMRIGGKVRMFDAEHLTREHIFRMLSEILSEEQQSELNGTSDLDFAYSLPKVGRFRLNVYRQRGSYSLAVRRVSTNIPSFEDLHLPAEILREITANQSGLVIVAGVTGSGKSTTLAAMIAHINNSRRCHIVTIEDPIEYLYRDNKAFINQREVGLDVPSFRAALASVVRQDPDVILIGEMRDQETLEAALQAAETGHLVFGTLHASSVAQAVGRILDLFPPERERQIRTTLRFNLKALVCQKILPSIKPGVPLVPAQEIMLSNPTTQKLIYEAEDKKLESVIRSSAEDGMQDFNQSLLKLVNDGLISQKVAMEASPNPEQLQMNIRGIFLGDDRKIVN